MSKFKLAALVFAACLASSSASASSGNTGYVNVSNASGTLTPSHGGSGATSVMAENSFWVMGDSRAANVFISTAPREGSLSELNWANTLLGHPYYVQGSSAVSSTRTDQLATQMTAALASTARNIYIRSGVNDISADYPTASTSGATACANLQTYTKQLINAGRRVFLAEEIGATGYTQSQLGQLQILRSCEEKYARANPGNLILVDFATAMYDPTNSTYTSLVFKTGYSTDGTHNARLGGYYLGKYFSTILQYVLPVSPTPIGVVAAYQDPANIAYGSNQIISNSNFLATSAISATGITGTGPTNWTFERTGSTTATVTMQNNTDTFGGYAGMGKEVVVAITCAAAGDTVDMHITPLNSTWTLTDSFIGTGGFSVAAGATNLSVPALRVWIFTNDAGSNVIGTFAEAMYNADEGTGTYYPAPSIAYSGRHVTPVTTSAPLSATQSYIYFGYSLRCTGVGSGTVTLRPAAMWKL